MIEGDKTCPECAEIVKGAAKVCRHCAYRFDSEPSVQGVGDLEVVNTSAAPSLPKSYIFGIGAIAALVILSFILAFYRIGEPSFDNRDVERRGIAFIKTKLVDPGSAQLEDVYSNDHCVTGRINAKNAFGGYVGFKAFYYDTRTSSGRIAQDKNLSDAVGTLSFDSVLEDQRAFDHESAVCINSEAEVAERDKQVEKMLADDRAKLKH